MMKRIVSIFLALTMLISLSTATFAGEGNSTNAVQETIVNNTIEDKVMQFSNETNEQYDKLIAHWNNQLPSYYAGAYIKDLKFVILVTCDPSLVEKDIWTATGNQNVIIQQVKNSYNDLASIRDNLVAKICNLQKDGDATANLIIGFGVDEINNRVFVEVLNNGQTNNQSIYNMIDNADVVDVIMKDKPYSPCTDINAGSKDWLVNNSNGSMSTISFCASRVNSLGVTENGFVIAGHAGNLYDQMKISGTIVGAVAARLYGGICDTSFVNMNNYPSSGYVRSRKLSTSYTIDGSANVGIVGTSYTMHGMYSGIISGTVNNTSFSFTMGGVSFTDHIRMQMATHAGDSGGPLVKQNSGYSRSVIGILSGGDSTYANFTKFSNIASAFNLTLYQ